MNYINLKDILNVRQHTILNSRSLSKNVIEFLEKKEFEMQRIADVNNEEVFSVEVDLDLVTGSGNNSTLVSLTPKALWEAIENGDDTITVTSVLNNNLTANVPIDAIVTSVSEERNALTTVKTIMEVSTTLEAEEAIPSEKLFSALQLADVPLDKSVDSVTNILSLVDFNAPSSIVVRDICSQLGAEASTDPDEEDGWIAFKWGDYTGKSVFSAVLCDILKGAVTVTVSIIKAAITGLGLLLTGFSKVISGFIGFLSNASIKSYTMHSKYSYNGFDIPFLTAKIGWQGLRNILRGSMMDDIGLVDLYGMFDALDTLAHHTIVTNGDYDNAAKNILYRIYDITSGKPVVVFLNSCMAYCYAESSSTLHIQLYALNEYVTYSKQGNSGVVTGTLHDLSTNIGEDSNAAIASVFAYSVNHAITHGFNDCCCVLGRLLDAAAMSTRSSWASYVTYSLMPHVFDNIDLWVDPSNTSIPKDSTSLANSLRLRDIDLTTEGASTIENGICWSFFFAILYHINSDSYVKQNPEETGADPTLALSVCTAFEQMDSRFTPWGYDSYAVVDGMVEGFQLVNYTADLSLSTLLQAEDAASLVTFNYDGDYAITCYTYKMNYARAFAITSVILIATVVAVFAASRFVLKKLFIRKQRVATQALTLATNAYATNPTRINYKAMIAAEKKFKRTNRVYKSLGLGVAPIPSNLPDSGATGAISDLRSLIISDN